MIEYYLEPNNLTEDPNDYRAQTVNVKSLTQADLIERIMRIGAGLTRSDIASVLEAEKQVITDVIADGGAMNTELFNAFPSISGVFNGAEDSFDADRHKVRINLHAGSAVREAIAAVKVKKVPAAPAGTVITMVTDLKTGSINDRLTPNRDLKINGSRLRITGEDAGVGLYFVSEADQTRTAVDMSDIVVNNPAEVIVVIPALEAGAYRVQIVTQFTGGKLLKTPRTVTFDKTLTVS